MHWETSLEIDGVSSMATALAVGGARLAVGTIDLAQPPLKRKRPARNPSNRPSSLLLF
jgi:hypothetical protein